MEDFIKFLLIAGVIIIGIVKEVKKNKSKKTADSPPDSSIPSMPERSPETIPMPEMWGGKTLEELLRPASHTPERNVLHRNTSPTPEKKIKEEISIESSLANSIAQDKRNSKEGTQYDLPSALDGNNESYAIRSAEEARRAIVWGEILQRKY